MTLPASTAAGLPARALATLTVLLLAALVVLLGGTPAAAHVLLAQAQPNGDGTTTLTFTFDHGCEGSPTTELTVSLPAGVSVTTTAEPDGWTGQVTSEQVTWTGSGIEDGAEAEFSAVARINGTVGQTFHFPTLQRCDNGGSYEWFDSQPGDEYPAPTLIATGAVLADPPPTAAAPADSSTGGASLPQALGAVTGLVAAAVAAAAFLTRRRATGDQPGSRTEG